VLERVASQAQPTEDTPYPRIEYSLRQGTANALNSVFIKWVGAQADIHSQYPTKVQLNQKSCYPMLWACRRWGSTFFTGFTPSLPLLSCPLLPVPLLHPVPLAQVMLTALMKLLTSKDAMLSAVAVDGYPVAVSKQALDSLLSPRLALPL